MNGEKLEEVVAKLLIENNISFAIAESCTGGLVSSRFTNVAGISKVFNRAFVTYSNESKIENLGVREDTIRNFGAVSEEVAKEMSEGVRNVSKTDIGVSITGIAGPEGGTEQKPVGLVYVALSDKNAVQCRELRLSGNREIIRNMAADYVFIIIKQYILNLSINS